MDHFNSLEQVGQFIFEVCRDEGIDKEDILCNLGVPVHHGLHKFHDLIITRTITDWIIKRYLWEEFNGTDEDRVREINYFPKVAIVTKVTVFLHTNLRHHFYTLH